jgi:hypothetical protein
VGSAKCKDGAPVATLPCTAGTMIGISRRAFLRHKSVFNVLQRLLHVFLPFLPARHAMNAHCCLTQFSRVHAPLASPHDSHGCMPRWPSAMPLTAAVSRSYCNSGARMGGALGTEEQSRCHRAKAAHEGMDYRLAPCRVTRSPGAIGNT